MAVEIKEEKYKLVASLASGEVEYHNTSPHIHFTVSNLEVFKSGFMYNRYDMKDEDYLFKYSLVGTASVENKTFSVIGQTDNKVNQVRVNINPLKAEAKEQYLDRLQEHISRKFMGKAELYFGGYNPETYTRAQWELNVYMTEAMIEELVMGITQKRIKTMDIGVHLDKGLYTTDPYADYGDKINYFLRPSKDSDDIFNAEISTGNLDSIEIQQTSGFNAAPVAGVAVDPVATSIKDLGAKVEGLQSTVKVVGGLIFLALVLLLFVVK